jgi:hypothetical protein
MTRRLATGKGNHYGLPVRAPTSFRIAEYERLA